MTQYTTKSTFNDLVVALQRANTIEKGEICAKVLLSKHISQSELASILGVERQTIYNWVSAFNSSVQESVGVAMPENLADKGVKNTQ